MQTMKHLFTTALLFLSILAQAQQFEEIKSKGSDFGMSTASTTGETITIDGRAFELHMTVKGSLFIKCLSPKTGNHYAVWIGEATGDRHDGKAVYKMKSGKLCIYRISEETDNPYAVWLKKKSD